MFTVSSFLCLRLRTAGVVIGWLGAAYSLLILAILLNFLVKTSQVSVPELFFYSERELLVCTIYLVIVTINLVSSLALIIGTIKESHLLIVPWLINHTILIGCSTLAVLILPFSFHHMDINKRSDMSITFITLIVCIAFESWLWVVINSLFKEIRNQRELRDKNDQERFIPNIVVAELTPPTHEFKIPFKL